MQKIWVVPFDKHLQHYHDSGILIDDHFAIVGSGKRIDDHIHLVQVLPTDHTSIYRAAHPFQYIKIAKGTGTSRNLETIVTQLHTVTAYELLTRCYDVDEASFDLNILDR